jgi:hypothetical protein
VTDLQVGLPSIVFGSGLQQVGTARVELAHFEEIGYFRFPHHDVIVPVGGRIVGKLVVVLLDCFHVHPPSLAKLIVLRSDSLSHQLLIILGVGDVCHDYKMVFGDKAQQLLGLFDGGDFLRRTDAVGNHFQLLLARTAIEAVQVPSLVANY